MLKVKRGITVIPDSLFDHSSGSFVELAEMMSKELGLFTIPYSQFDSKNKYDIVLSLGAPSRAFSGSEFLSIPSSTKLLYWLDDCTWYSEDRRREFRNVIDKSYAVVTPNITKFGLLWSEFKHKAFHFPFYATGDFLSLGFNENPKERCLLSGRTFIGKNQNAYPLRRMVHDQDHHLTDILPRFGSKAINKKEYALMLNSYLCGVTDGSRCYDDFRQCSNGDIRSKKYLEGVFNNVALAKISGQVVKKYFEIPATGSLLLAEETCKHEMDELGFQPFTNYVPVTCDNVFEMVETCVSNRDWADKIRLDGMKMIASNHTIENRRLEFRKLIRQW